MNFTPAQTAVACLKYGSQVGPLPPQLAGDRLLWALTGVESSHGTNCTPRHEPAFDVGGKYGSHAPMPTLIALYGSPAAACSYGPLQVMLCNMASAAPADFDNINTAFELSINFLNQQLRHFNPQTLAEIGEIWNAGSIRPDPAYTTKLSASYVVSLPQGN